MKKFLLVLLIGIVCCGSCSMVDEQNAARKSQLAVKAKAVSQAFDDADAALTEYKKSKSPASSKHLDQAMATISQAVDELKPAVGSDKRDQQILKNVEIIMQTSLHIMTEERAQADILNSDNVDKTQFRARHMYKGSQALTTRMKEELSGFTTEN